MMRPQPMLVVADVEAASQWFQDVLGLESGHGGPQYEMLMDGGEMVAQIHRPEGHEHPHLGPACRPPGGDRVVLWFATDDFDGLVARAQAAAAVVLDGPLFNPNGHQHEIWLEGPEGCLVVVAGPRS